MLQTEGDVLNGLDRSILFLDLVTSNLELLWQLLNYSSSFIGDVLVLFLHSETFDQGLSIVGTNSSFAEQNVENLVFKHDNQKPVEWYRR